MHVIWGGWNALFEISTFRSFDIWDKLHSYRRPIALKEKIALCTGQTDSQPRRLSHHRPSKSNIESLCPPKLLDVSWRKEKTPWGGLINVVQSCRKTCSLNYNDHWPTWRWPSSTPRSRWAPRKRQSQAATWWKRNCSWEKDFSDGIVKSTFPWDQLTRVARVELVEDP